LPKRITGVDRGEKRKGEPPMKLVMVSLLALLVALPISAVLTWMLAGFWNWFELHSGIDSIGHSGPAGWCYIALYVIHIMFSVGAWLFFKPRKG
jgi:hypothetical protein